MWIHQLVNKDGSVALGSASLVGSQNAILQTGMMADVWSPHLAHVSPSANVLRL